jgi:hypothetical protein
MFFPRKTGILKYWNVGIMEKWNNGKKHGPSSDPSFYYSIIPFFASASSVAKNII